MHQHALWEQFLAIVAARRAETIVAECSETSHRMVLNHNGLEPLDHDTLSEEALFALGGDPPSCIQLQRAWSFAIQMDGPMPLFMYEGPVAEDQRTRVGAHASNLGVSVSVRGVARIFGINVSNEMRSLLTLASSEGSIRKNFLLFRLVRDYEGAQGVVKEQAARLGLQVAAGTHRLTDTTLIDIKELYALPKSIIGPTEWSKRELILLMRTGRPPKDEPRRKQMLSELSKRLEDGVCYLKDDVGALLRPYTIKPWALLGLLTKEGFLVRERSPDPPRRRFVWRRPPSV